MRKFALIMLATISTFVTIEAKAQFLPPAVIASPDAKVLSMTVEYVEFDWSDWTWTVKVKACWADGPVRCCLVSEDGQSSTGPAGYIWFDMHPEIPGSEIQYKTFTGVNGWDWFMVYGHDQYHTSNTGWFEIW